MRYRTHTNNLESLFWNDLPVQILERTNGDSWLEERLGTPGVRAALVERKGIRDPRRGCGAIRGRAEPAVHGIERRADPAASLSPRVVSKELTAAGILTIPQEIAKSSVPGATVPKDEPVYGAEDGQSMGSVVAAG
jgi:hypothetical protein